MKNTPIPDSRLALGAPDGLVIAALIALCLAAYSIITELGTETLDLLMWSIMLLLQAVPYAAALLVSIVSAFPRLPARFIGASLRRAAADRRQLPLHR